MKTKKQVKQEIKKMRDTIKATESVLFTQQTQSGFEYYRGKLSKQQQNLEVLLWVLS